MIEFVRQILLYRLKNGCEIKKDFVKECFDIAEQFSKLAIQKKYIVPTHCLKCNSEIKVVDVSTKVKEFRAVCECSNSTGKNKNDAIFNLIEGS